MDNYCLPIAHLLMILSVFLGFFILYIEPPKNIILIQNKKLKNDELLKNELLMNRDINVIKNPLQPPERRLPNYAYPFNIITNIPTRGIPDNYHQFGIAFRENTETGFNVFGRQKYPGSNQYEYYVIGTMGFNQVKIPLKIKGDKELEDGQMIDIPGNNGLFKFKLFDYDIPRYNPL